MWKGFLNFFFENKVDWDIIFRSGSYFMGAQGLYMDCRGPYFNLESDVPFVVLVWVKLLFLPLHCWNENTFWSIDNTLGKYIDWAELQDGLLASTQICVEVDLDKGLPATISMNLDN